MESALITVVPILFTGLVLLFFLQPGANFRIAFCKAQIAAFLFVALSTEFASACKIINARGIFAIWAIAALTIWVFALITISRRRSLTFKFKERIKALATLDRGTWLLVALIGFILASTMTIGLLSAPNTYDSMTYHMARVPHWIQQQSIDFFPTENWRQNSLSPLAEYSILHLQLLSQTDRFANLVQWSSFLLAIIVGSLIAGEFGQSSRVQLLTGVVVATIPMAILQASSTQNDLVVGALCMCFALFLIRSLKTKSTADFAFCSAALGLALLAKTTGYFYCCESESA